MAIQQSINNMLGTVGTVAGIASALDKSAQKEAAKFEAEKANREFKADVEEAAISNQLLNPAQMPKTDEDYNKLYEQVQAVRNDELKDVKNEAINTRDLYETLAEKRQLGKEDMEFLKSHGYEFKKGRNGELVFKDPETNKFISREEYASKAKQDKDRALNRLRERQDRLDTTEQLKFKKDEAYKNYQTMGKGLIGKIMFNKEGK